MNFKNLNSDGFYGNAVMMTIMVAATVVGILLFFPFSDKSSGAPTESQMIRVQAEATVFGNERLLVFHDKQNAVTCWCLSGRGITCLPDQALRPQVLDKK